MTVTTRSGILPFVPYLFLPVPSPQRRSCLVNAGVLVTVGPSWPWARQSTTQWRATDSVYQPCFPSDPSPPTMTTHPQFTFLHVLNSMTTSQKCWIENEEEFGRILAQPLTE